MTLSARPVPILSDNYAWLLTDSASGAVGIVDPADAAACSRAVDEAGGRLDMILITHHHDDHIAGVDAMRDKAGLLNVMHAVAMGGSNLFSAKDAEKNRVVEIWAVVP